MINKPKSWKLFFLFIFYSTLLFAQSPLGNHDMKGPVRIVIEESFEGEKRDSTIVKNGKNHQYSWIQDNKMEFDRNKNLIKRSFYGDDKTPLREDEYFFRGTQLEKKIIQAFTYLYKEDPAKKVKEEMLVSKSDSTDLWLKQRFLKDEYDRIIEIWEFDMKGGHVRHQKNQYDSQGHLSKETIKYKDGIEYKVFSYNAEGKLDKMEWFDFQVGLLERTTFTYKEGKKSREYWESFDDGAVESTTTTDYDENENPVSILEINEKRRIHDHEINLYEYDNQKNWVKKTTAINNSRFYIVERRIGYYN